MINIWADTFLHASGAAEKDYRDAVHPDDRAPTRRKRDGTRSIERASKHVKALGVALAALVG